MANQSKDQKSELLKKLFSLAKSNNNKNNKASKIDNTNDFLEAYFSDVPIEDLADHDANSLLAAALDQLKFMIKRPAGEALVRVFNPTMKGENWESKHTVIEIVTKNSPFIIDSVSAFLSRLGLSLHLIVHPILKVKRTGAGALQELDSIDSVNDWKPESVVHIEITRQSGNQLIVIEQGISDILVNVKLAVTDWQLMRDTMESLIVSLDDVPKGMSQNENKEVRDFLKWINNDHYTFLGYREYNLKVKNKKSGFVVNQSTNLGILRNSDYRLFSGASRTIDQSLQILAFAQGGKHLLVTKSNQRSLIHRHVHMDVVAVKVFDSSGNLTGVRMFTGLFTSSAYNRSPRDIPLLRQRLNMIMEESGYQPESHAGKALMNILETYPRDELFQVSDDDLLRTSIGIMNLQERKRTGLFMRNDDFGRFVSCMVFLAKDGYTTKLRLDIEKILCGAFGGSISTFYTQLDGGEMARIHFIVRTPDGKVPKYDVTALEKEIIQASRSWVDRVHSKLLDIYGEEEAQGLIRQYGDSFSTGYQAHYISDHVVQDIHHISQLSEKTDVQIGILNQAQGVEENIRFKIYHPELPVALSDVLPMFENMGFKVIDELPFTSEARRDVKFDTIIHDFGLVPRKGISIDMDKVKTNLLEAFLRVWHNEMESDRFNILVSSAGFNWREVVIVRAYAKYLRQAGISFSQDYVATTLTNNDALAKDIIELFMVKFDPVFAQDRQKAAAKIIKRLDSGLATVVSADEDRILRLFINIVESTLRTNFFQVGEDGNPKGYLSFKLDSHKVEEMPLPRPFREIFVYSPEVEGVHLRFGMVARGGLRWSDRPEDFRTEVLGLVKAQQVKNAVIVPVGSKGGFVVKRPIEGATRDQFLEKGIECYKTFIAGLLDITDNIVGPKTTYPKNVIRLDDDDPYLVVAADKGTATFSDIANSVSIEKGHWLGDAFASGGSQGYDHKKMGITAKGGWESVKRHFREMGTDIQSESFSVVGVGDMAGDVFGNGMLLSKFICLKAAFNHLHIFVDPEPDHAKTYVERKRLFDMPRSSWSDFNTKLLSKGGAIYERSAKSLTMTPEIKKCFGISKNTLTPNELIGHILRSQIDLLWFGGIGTYVKSTRESHLDCGDRANDSLRINGNQLNCRVIGEGANLGMTQLGRIEFAENGGNLNTDSIDNSAGVDSSDHEVNIKILLNAVMDNKKLTMPQRNKLLASMTDEVGELVLVHNYTQSLAISMIESRGVSALDNQKRLMRDFERRGNLNRAVEYLPDEEIMLERSLAHKALYRPEIAVLMSYSKIWLYDQVLASNVPDDPGLLGDLVNYFPTPLRKKYLGEIKTHRLRREIIVTRLINSLVNRAGDTFVHEFMEKTGAAPDQIIRAYAIVREVFDLRQIWSEIEALDNKVTAKIQISMFEKICQLINRTTLWFLRQGNPGLELEPHIKEFKAGIAALAGNMKGILPAHYVKDLQSRAKVYQDAGVPEKLALRIAGLVNLNPGCDIVRTAQNRKRDTESVAQAYFAVGTRFKLGRLRAATEKLDSESHWGQLAIAAQIEEIFGHQLALAKLVLDMAPKKKLDGDKSVASWVEANASIVAPTDQLLTELWAADVNDLSMVSVTSRQLRAMIEAGNR